MIVKNPQGKGYLDNNNIWKRTQDQRGGPHWDVQHPDGSHTNVFPDGNVVGPDNKAGQVNTTNFNTAETIPPAGHSKTIIYEI